MINKIIISHIHNYCLMTVYCQECAEIMSNIRTKLYDNAIWVTFECSNKHQIIIKYVSPKEPK